MFYCAVVKIQIPANRDARHADAIVGVQVNLFVFDRFPDALDEDIVAPGALAIHADRDLVGDQHAGERFAVNWLPWSVLNIPRHV